MVSSSHSYPGMTVSLMIWGLVRSLQADLNVFCSHLITVPPNSETPGFEDGFTHGNQ